MFLIIRSDKGQRIVYSGQFALSVDKSKLSFHSLPPMQHHMLVYLETYHLYIYNKLRKLIDKML